MTILTISLLLLLCASAFCSSSEVALFSLKKSSVAALKQSKNPVKRIPATLLETPKATLNSILIGNTMVNICISTFFTTALIRRFGHSVAIEMTAIAVLTAVILLFCEIMPKMFAYKYNERLSILFGPSVKVLRVLVFPVRFFLDLFVNFFIGRLGFSKTITISNTETNLIRLIKSTTSNEILPKEKRLLRKVLIYDKKDVSDIMIPRIEIKAISLDQPLEEICEALVTSRHRYVPVYTNELDDIYGILDARNFLLKKEQSVKQLKKHIKKPFYIPVNINLRQALAAFKKRHEKVALAVDEYGGIEGFISLNDIAEEITGEITSLYKKTDDLAHAEGKVSFRIKGNASIEDINIYLGLKLNPGTVVVTIGGLVCERLGRVPKHGEWIDIENVRFFVVKATKTRILELVVLKQH